jgi:hypothetical protein
MTRYGATRKINSSLTSLALIGFFCYEVSQLDNFLKENQTNIQIFFASRLSRSDDFYFHWREKKKAKRILFFIFIFWNKCQHDSDGVHLFFFFLFWVAGIFDPTAFYSWPTPTTQTTRFRSLCLTFLIVFLSVLVWCDLLAGNSNQRGKNKSQLAWESLLP